MTLGGWLAGKVGLLVFAGVCVVGGTAAMAVNPAAGIILINIGGDAAAMAASPVDPVSSATAVLSGPI